MPHKNHLFYQTLQKYLPDNAVHYCFDLWKQHPFHFKIARRRNSKLGDYRYDPVSKSNYISVNGDLNPYNFLVTYVHEVAHLVTYATHGRIKNPHGKEWKRTFSQLMEPLLSDLVFPADLLPVLKNHLSNPKASSCSDPDLYRALRTYDQKHGFQLLSEIASGESFIFHNRLFEKGSLRRTRVLCKEVNTGKRYLIPQVALVEKAKDPESIK